MNSRPLTEIEELLTDDERRRTVSINDQPHFQRSLQAADIEESDFDPGDFNPPSRLKERDLNRTLAILDEIASNLKGGKP